MKKVKEHKTIVELYNKVKDIDPEKFITNRFRDSVGNCCILGHYNLAKHGDAEDYKEDLWTITEQIYRRLHPKEKTESFTPNVATINNRPLYNGYKHESIKDRGICFLEDYLEATDEIKKEDRLVKEHVT